MTVYPRVCGGTDQFPQYAPHQDGLSPRVRGNLRGGCRYRHRAGSIPACAGEPSVQYKTSMASTVYPRVCGGTEDCIEVLEAIQGLSPRVRGNRGLPPGAADGLRSIPACAGEPTGYVVEYRVGRVYPRVCGGTIAPAGRPRPPKGLSPRVRGNRVVPLRKGPREGSIPACAGEPHTSAIVLLPLRVYPRVCGGTGYPLSKPMLCCGLSPRVRGNQAVCSPSHVSVGSIPACAGEPFPGNRRPRQARVYPRVCGGTSPGIGKMVPQNGLSPRVRGNRPGHVPQHPWRGSIPACAGEPPHQYPARWLVGVYPRVCGGTHWLYHSSRSASGLSPRVRGNRKHADG